MNRKTEKPVKDVSLAQLDAVQAASAHQDAIKVRELLQAQAISARANSEAIAEKLRDAEVAEHKARQVAAEAEQESVRAVEAARRYVD